MGLLGGKTAVITGASRGLGLALAQAYAAEGANLVLAARTQATLDQAVDNLTNDGVQAIGFACDISNYDEAEALAALALARFGKLDIWVNNAGISAPYGPTFSIPLDRFERVLQTNIFGLYYGSYAAMKTFIPQNSGKLINLLGRGSDQPVPNQNAYASSKGWVNSFTKALAKEYRHTGISIIAFNPGLVLTEMLTEVEVMPGLGEKIKPLNTVIRLWANPPEVPAKKAVWLASSATDGKTGLTVNVLTPWGMVMGLVKDAVRKLSGKPGLTPDIHIREVG